MFIAVKPSMHIPRLTYAALLLGTLVWCAGIVAAPVFSISALYDFYHRICHQLGSHSLHISGEPLAVCARCTAIYFGFLIGMLVYPTLRSVSSTQLPSRIVLFGAAVPMLLDVVGGLAGVHTVTITTRLITGGLFGVVLPFFILPAGVGAVLEIFHVKRQTVIPQSMKGLSDA